MVSKKFTYPNIDTRSDRNDILFDTWVRIKRTGIWYDVNVTDHYKHGGDKEKYFEVFKDKLILTKLFWNPPHNSPFSIPTSENQEETTDDLLDDEERVTKLKNLHDKLHSKEVNDFPSTNQELDPFFLDMFTIFNRQGNVTVKELNQKVEAYVDSRIENYLKK